jgi:bifunctional non-homologous end joining protein LigD
MSALPAMLQPQLATLLDKPPAGEWIWEIKLDGYRMLARVGERGDVRLVTRRGNDWTARFPRLVQELVSARLPPGWYDGELVALDEQGLPDFNRLQNAIERRAANEKLVFYLFDAPYAQGRDLRGTPVEERQALLASLLRETELLRLSKPIGHSSVHEILATACRLGLEGVIGKRRGSTYSSRRSPHWIKLKCTRREEFVIGGYTWPDEARSDPGIGSLLVGQWDRDGALHYAGKVGAGYTMASSAQLRAQLDAIAQRERPFAETTGHDTHATWVRPELVCEVAYNDWPEGGALRHASFKGLRAPEDKPARAVTRSKVVDATTGITVDELAGYYRDVARWMLPFIHRRHAYVARFPHGLAGERIFQQHPQGMRAFKGTDRALWPGHEPAIAFETPADLVAAVRSDMVEVHTWNSTAQAILQPDRVVFDLDPGEGVGWDEVREGALLVKTMLDELGLDSWLKTSGGKGLHLYVPLLPEFDHASVKRFSQEVVEHLSRTLPQRFVAKSGSRNRVGRIFIDYLRNGQSQSTCEAYSARARPGMGVSMPIAWPDLERVESSAHWHVRNAIAHLNARRRDPWAGYWKARQSLHPAMAAMEASYA